MTSTVTFAFNKAFLEKFRGALLSKDEAFIRAAFDNVNDADISAFLETFSSAECKYILNLLDVEVGAHIIKELDEGARDKFLESFSAEEIANYVGHLETDDGADILYELDESEQKQVIELMHDPEKARNIVELLEYEEDVAGGIMSKELIKANLNWSIKQCIEEIRKQAESVNKIYAVYVVDDENKLIGKVSLKDIILARDSTKVGSIFDGEIVSVDSAMAEEEVAAVMSKYDLDVVAVVNAAGQLVGRITNDDIIDVITENAEEERQLMSGISDDVEEDDNIWKLSRARLPWLMIGLIGGAMAAYFIGLYEDQIILIPAMSFFIPLIMATGGNVGIQSSSLIVQSLASPSAFKENLWNRLFKSLLVSIVNGVILAIFVYLIVLSFDNDVMISLVVSIALFSVVLLASLMGTITPLLLNRLGINPALASGPFITTANDLLGIFVYFTIASALYQFS